jgi:branched-subunit amino acid ABC-type transport system permease component
MDLTPEIVLSIAAIAIAVWFQVKRGSMLPFALAALVTIGALWALFALVLKQNPFAGDNPAGALIQAVGILVGLVYGLLRTRRRGR